MIFISHRGNIDLVRPDQENSPSYIDNAIILGYDVELDARFLENKLFLGHDAPDHAISLEWLLERKNNIWVHAKNFAALSFLIDKDLKIFYHQKEDHTIINNCNIIWSHNLDEADGRSIIPLLNKDDILKFVPKSVYGICSDFVSTLKTEEK